MSKELEALERMYCSGNLQLNYVLSNKHKQDYETIEQALQRLESIDNANPSEALEELDSGFEVHTKEYGNMIAYGEEQVDTIKQALLKSQEQEKVLKIVFEKYVDLNLLDCDDDVGQYNRHFGKDRQLTQEEFELLKEMLK